MAERKQKPFVFSDYWAAYIYRTNIGGTDKIGALVYRKYDEMDVDTNGPGRLIGIEDVPVYKMITDTDPESETFNKRIPDGEPIRTKRKFMTDFNEKTSAEYRKLVGATAPGITKLVFVYREHAYQTEDTELFFGQKTMKELYQEVVSERPQIVIKSEPLDLEKNRNKK